MVLRYENYDDLEIDKEMEKMDYADLVEINLYPSDKRCLFFLGMLFAKGKKIKLLNEKEFDFHSIDDENTKSYPLMAYVWSKFSDDSFPKKDYSDVVTKMDNLVENIKRLGYKVSPIVDNPDPNQIFLICPVRNASANQKNWIVNYVYSKTREGYKIHAPHLNTRQVDMFKGYAICRQNAEAVAKSSEVAIYYDKSSTGSVFDLGVSYVLGKGITLLNADEILLNENDFADNLIKNWPYNKEEKTLMKEPEYYTKRF